MSHALRNILTCVLLAVLALLAAAWWTDWLDPHVPQLVDWRKQAQQTSVGQALSAPPAPPEPVWVETPARDREECLRQSGGELNADYMMCRSGKRELVREHANGSREIIQSQPLAPAQGLFLSQ